MFGERKVNLTLTTRAKKYIEQMKAEGPFATPVLGISWSRVSDQQHEKWVIGLYEREDMREGWMGVAPEFDFIVIQEWILEAVNNKVLDVSEAGQVTIDAS
jgi:hypothetical protein